MSNSRKKTIVLVLGMVLAACGAGAAYAFWTATGSGTGTGATSAGTGTVTVVQTSVISDLKPGGAPQTLSGNFTNPAGNGTVYVTSVTASIASVTKASGAVAGTCDATDYTLANATMNVGADVPVGTAQGSWSGATLAFNNKGTNQDSCKGATVNLSYAAS